MPLADQPLATDEGLVHAETLFGAHLAGDLRPAIRAARADTMRGTLADVAALLHRYLTGCELPWPGAEHGGSQVHVVQARELLAAIGLGPAAVAGQDLGEFTANADRTLSGLGRRELRRRILSLAGRAWELACAEDDQAGNTEALAALPPARQQAAALMEDSHNARVVLIIVLHRVQLGLCPDVPPSAFRRLAALLADPWIRAGADLACCSAQVAIEGPEFTFITHDCQAGRKGRPAELARHLEIEVITCR
jgi:hypothetical protein